MIRILFVRRVLSRHCLRGRLLGFISWQSRLTKLLSVVFIFAHLFQWGYECLDANPTRIEPFREVCDANAFKIATSLIITGVELPGQLAARSKNAKMHSKLPVRSCYSFPVFSSFGLPARAGIGSSQHLCSRLKKILDGVIRRSSGKTDARAWSLYEITEFEVSARAGKRALERTARSQISRFD